MSDGGTGAGWDAKDTIVRPVKAICSDDGIYLKLDDLAELITDIAVKEGGAVGLRLQGVADMFKRLEKDITSSGEERDGN